MYSSDFILLGNTSKAYVCNITTECDSLIGNGVCDVSRKKIEKIKFHIVFPCYTSKLTYFQFNLIRCMLNLVYLTVKPVLRGLFREKKKWPYKTGDLLKGVQFI